MIWAGDCKIGRAMGGGGLIIWRLLPLNINVTKAARSYEVKRGNDMGDTFVNRALEKPVYFDDLPHPVYIPKIGYKSVEELETQTILP
ncbi:hypothetical protein EVAR_57060_1 [Eumeta japonica]|uniref:Uncharacterized protein n=1 Tax=Eumeta variegata TaxID=151549 RepID=A0A4C1YTP0_EUMVA|nr:hypothetical protein EVAR_57060_1 [Eumeta japonica]